MNRTLRLCRVGLDMNVKELAEKMHKSEAYISDVEAGRKNPSLPTLTKYAEVYGIPLSQILFFHEIQEKVNLSNSQLLLKIVEYVLEQEKKVLEEQKEKNLEDGLLLVRTIK